MKIIDFNHNLDEVIFSKPTTLVIGKFETFHLGHQVLIHQAKKTALAKNHDLIVMLYDLDVFSKPTIFTNEDRIRIATKLGIENLLFFIGNNENYRLSLEEFVKIIKHKYGVKSVFVGNDFKFNKFEGDLEYFSNLIEVEQIKQVKQDNFPVSSSIIKSFLMSSEIDQANSFLGFNYFYSGRVIPGKNFGTLLLKVPTANIKRKNIIQIGNGIYFSYLIFDGKKYPSVTSIYSNDTLSNDGVIHYETYILNFNKNIYGKNVRVELVKFLRFPRKYGNIDALKKAINDDIKEAIKYFSKN